MRSALLLVCPALTLALAPSHSSAPPLAPARVASPVNAAPRQRTEHRRRAVCAAIALAPLGCVARPADAAPARPVLYETRSGLRYFDVQLGDAETVKSFRLGAILEQAAAPAPLASAEDGATTRIEYRVRTVGFDGEIVEASDSGTGLGGVKFDLGDGSVNPAVDELVRTLPKGVTRRAIVPASYKLIRKNQVAYYDEWPVVSFLELSLRKASASSSIFQCSQVDGACVCTPGIAAGGTDVQSKRD